MKKLLFTLNPQTSPSQFKQQLNHIKLTHQHDPQTTCHVLFLFPETGNYPAVSPAIAEHMYHINREPPVSVCDNLYQNKF